MDEEIVSAIEAKINNFLLSATPMEEGEEVLKRFRMNQHLKAVDKIKTSPEMSSMQEIVPGLFLGSCLSHDYETLINSGITHVVCVRTKEEEEFQTRGFPDRFRYKTIPIDETPSSNVIPFIPQVKDFIDDCFNNNGKVLVQCYFGVSRSASVVIGYIMETYNMTLSDALRLVQDKRTCVNPNPNFLNQLNAYEAIYKARRLYNSGHSSKQTGYNKRPDDDMEDGTRIDVLSMAQSIRSFFINHQ